jgi:DNA-binding PadR family transcriptional regulator
MVADGWIVEVVDEDHEQARRRYYRLSPWGRRVAEAEAERLADLVRVARHRKLLPLRAT